MIKKCPFKPAAFGFLLLHCSSACRSEEECVGQPSCAGKANIPPRSPQVPGGGKCCGSTPTLPTAGWEEWGKAPVLLLSYLLRRTEFFFL